MFATIGQGPGAAERARLEALDALGALGVEAALARQARALAHDLGNLVGVVRGATALITAGVGDAGLWASRIETAMDGATALLERLRAQAEPPPDLRPTDLRGPVGAAGNLARVRLHDVDLRLDLPAGPVVAPADPPAVTRVVLDLALGLGLGLGPDGDPAAEILVVMDARGLHVTRPGAAAADVDLPGDYLLARAGCAVSRETSGFRLSWPAAATGLLEAVE
jgi:hypothetical protein